MLINQYRYEDRVKLASIILGEQPMAERVITEVYQLENGIEALTINQLLLILAESSMELNEYWV